MKTRKRVLSVLLTAALCLGLLAVAPVAASAAGEIGIAAGVPTFTVNTATPTLVGFGGKQWAVIGHNTTGVASESGKLTLLLANGESYGTSAFDSTSRKNNEYSGSTLKTAMETAYGTLPAKEQALVAARDLAGGSGLYGTGTYDGDKVAGAAVTGAKFWPLSFGEATAVNATVRNTGFWWWLRSPGFDPEFAANVGGGDSVDFYGYHVDGGGGVEYALLCS